MKDGSEKSRVSDQMNWGGFAEWETPGGGGGPGVGAREEHAWDALNLSACWMTHEGITRASGQPEI